MKGIGVDCVLISRIQHLLIRRLDPYSFAKKILSVDELSHFKNYFLAPTSIESVTFLAGRFAIKEAAFKALSSASLVKSSASNNSYWSFKDIETMAPNSNSPPVTVYKPINKRLLSSLSHDGGMAIAMVMVQ